MERFPVNWIHVHKNKFVVIKILLNDLEMFVHFFFSTPCHPPLPLFFFF